MSTERNNQTRATTENLTTPRLMEGMIDNVTVLTDGDVGLRELQHEAAPHGDHVTDWFHIGMRFRS